MLKKKANKKVQISLAYDYRVTDTGYIEKGTA
jgi:hypothetical protein